MEGESVECYGQRVNRSRMVRLGYLNSSAGSLSRDRWYPDSIGTVGTAWLAEDPGSAEPTDNLGLRSPGGGDQVCGEGRRYLFEAGVAVQGGVKNTLNRGADNRKQDEVKKQEGRTYE